MTKALRTIMLPGIELGGAQTAIIVPLMTASLEQLCSGAERIRASGAHVLEWRADHLAPEVEDPARHRALVLEGAGQLRDQLGPRGQAGPALLVTMRTAAEGGQRTIADADLAELLVALAEQGAADLLDVEHARGSAVMAPVLAAAHEHGIAVIASRHHMAATPPVPEIVDELRRMQEAGADAVKIAVMPRDPGDVAALLAASWQMRVGAAEVPLIAISMGSAGAVSRVAARTFGSAATFASLGAASAPGQIGLEELRAAMRVLEP